MPGFSIPAIGSAPAIGSQSLSIVVPHASAASGSGSSRAAISQAGGAHSLVFAVGNAGESLSGVTVTIRDVAGCTVATLALPVLRGTQALLWRPEPGLAAGAYAAYWEGEALAAGD